VTPQEWSTVKALSEELGLPYSKIYNMAFNALLEKLGRK
jgi:sugar-specific transcriptional regulator TrmB